MDPDQYLDWLERAAIMEYDGGLSRFDAERRAREIQRRASEPQPGLFDSLGGRTL